MRPADPPLAPLADTRPTALVLPLPLTMSLFAWLLLSLLRGAPGGPVHHALWSKEVNPVEAQRDLTSFYRLPVYQDLEGPLVAPEVFRPVPYKVPLPTGLTALLLPPPRREHTVQEAGARAVDVRCGVDSVSVRVDRSKLGAWTVPDLFRLGSCKASSARGRFLYFHSGLMECGGQAKVVGGQLVYTYLLSYNPLMQGHVIRVPPLRLPIHCHYNRFHYSYKVGFSPEVQLTTFMKSIRSKRSFGLTVLNAQGEPMPPGHLFFLGEQVNFLAQTDNLLDGERLYMDSCYATSSKDPNSTPQLDIIAHNGCMTDSKRPGSRSQFLQRADNELQFSVDAFIFNAASQMVYLHCAMSVALATSQSAKSCNYNKGTGRWEELLGPTSVCSCCDSVCTDSQNNIKNTVSSSGWFVGTKNDAKPRMRAKSSQAQDERKWVDGDRQWEVNEDADTIEDFQRETVIAQDEEKELGISKGIPVLPKEKKQWRQSSAVSKMGKTGKEKGETEEKLMKIAIDKTPEKIMSDQTGPEGEETEEARDKIPHSRQDSDGLTGDNKITDASHGDSDPSTVTTTFTVKNNNDKNNDGPASNISTPAIPYMTLCPYSANMDCSDSAEHGTVDTAIGTESYPSYNVTATSGTGQLDSIQDLRIQENVHSNGFKKLAGTHQTTADSWSSAKSSVEGDQEESGSVSSDLVSSEEEPWGASATVNAKGLYENDGMFRSLQIRELELERSADPTGLSGLTCADGLDCESDLNSGPEEGEAHQQSQAAGEFETKKEKGEEFAVDFGSIQTAQIQQDGPSHFDLATAATPLPGPESRHMIEWEWADLMPQWDLHSLGFVVERAIPEEDGHGQKEVY